MQIRIFENLRNSVEEFIESAELDFELKENLKSINTLFNYQKTSFLTISYFLEAIQSCLNVGDYEYDNSLLKNFKNYINDEVIKSFQFTRNKNIEMFSNYSEEEIENMVQKCVNFFTIFKVCKIRT